mgnify:CR=1 FL=1
MNETLEKLRTKKIRKAELPSEEEEREMQALIDTALDWRNGELQLHISKSGLMSVKDVKKRRSKDWKNFRSEDYSRNG